MREYKFRAWDETEKHMYNWGNLINQNLKNIFTITEQCGYILMQYTGLHDKNGKEIWEGDIVKISEKNNIAKHKVIPMKPIIAEISWSEEYLAYILIITSAKDAFENLADYLDDYDIEKIGNIYENKELLNETNR